MVNIWIDIEDEDGKLEKMRIDNLRPEVMKKYVELMTPEQKTNLIMELVKCLALEKSAVKK